MSRNFTYRQHLYPLLCSGALIVLATLLTLHLGEDGRKRWPGVTSGVQVVRASSIDAEVSAVSRDCRGDARDPLSMSIGEGWRAMPSREVLFEWQSQADQWLTVALTQQRGHPTGCWEPYFLIGQRWLPENITGPNDPSTDPPFDPGDGLPVPCPSLPSGDPPAGMYEQYRMYSGPPVKLDTNFDCDGSQFIYFGSDPYAGYGSWDRLFTWDGGKWLGMGFGLADDSREWDTVTIYSDPEIRMRYYPGVGCRWEMLFFVYNKTTTPTRWPHHYIKEGGSSPAGIYWIDADVYQCPDSVVPQYLIIEPVT